MTCGARPNPKPMISAGAMATTGVTLNRTATGMIAERSNGTWMSNVANTSATPTPQAKPSTALTSV